MNNLNWARTMMQDERYGYKNVSDMEACLWEDIGDEAFVKVIDYGFRIAYWTVKHKELIPGSPEYNQYFAQARSIAVEKALELVCDDRKDYLDLLILSDKEIVQNAKKELNSESLRKQKPVMLKKAN